MDGDYKSYVDLKLKYADMPLKALAICSVAGNIFWLFRDIFLTGYITDAKGLWLEIVFRGIPALVLLLFPFFKGRRQLLTFIMMWTAILGQQIIYSYLGVTISGAGFITWLFAFVIFAFCNTRLYTIDVSVIVYLMLIITSSDTVIKEPFLIFGKIHYTLGLGKILTPMFIIAFGCCLITHMVDACFKGFFEEHMKVKYLSEHDSLSGLYNRTRLSELERDGWKDLDDCTVIMFDIDDFKYFNDTSGHDGGDRIIREFAVLLRETFNHEKDMIFRQGGDEFMVITYNSMDTERLLGRLFSRCSFKVSAGYADYRKGYDDFSEIMKDADHALYYVKEHGKNSFLKYVFQ